MKLESRLTYPMWYHSHHIRGENYFLSMSSSLIYHTIWSSLYYDSLRSELQAQLSRKTLWCPERRGERACLVCAKIQQSIQACQARRKISYKTFFCFLLIILRSLFRIFIHICIYVYICIIYITWRRARRVSHCASILRLGSPNDLWRVSIFPWSRSTCSIIEMSTTVRRTKLGGRMVGVLHNDNFAAARRPGPRWGRVENVFRGASMFSSEECFGMRRLPLPAPWRSFAPGKWKQKTSGRTRGNRFEFLQVGIEQRN